MGDLAEKHGIEKIYWADMEYINILGIWKERRLHIYGEYLRSIRGGSNAINFLRLPFLSLKGLISTESSLRNPTQ
jgi:hypothetical protein